MVKHVKYIGKNPIKAPQGFIEPGAVLALDDATATRWVDGGLFEEVTAPPKAAKAVRKTKESKEA